MAQAIHDSDMIKPQDKILIGLSGGKDSLTLLHSLKQLATYSPVKFSIAAVTVDYQNSNYQPKPLIKYLKKLNVEYFYVSEDIVTMAKKYMIKKSYTAFSSRIRRGIIYHTARDKGYNVVALAQHADDILITFFMSLMFEGAIRTMKSHYQVDKGDLRVIRPFCYLRERVIRDFASTNNLPIVAEGMPKGMAAPKQRESIKKLLNKIESEEPTRINTMLRAIKSVI